MRVVNAIGVIFLISAGWWLAARALQFDNANWFEAIVFGAVVYFGFRSLAR